MKHLQLACASMTAMLCFSGVARAETDETAKTVSPAIHSNCANAPFRDFDFWLGTWEVRTPDGELAGTNRITSEAGGCIIYESWTDTAGETGHSMNFVDRATGKWRQVWVSSGITLDYSGGLDEEGVMRLEGEIAYAENPERNGPFRGAWTLQEDGTVLQQFHQYFPSHKAWGPWFTGIYTRIEKAD